MYDRLKAHGAEIEKKGICNVPINDIRQIVMDTATDSSKETMLIAIESPEIATGVTSWSAFLASTFTMARKKLGTEEFCQLLTTGMIQLAAVVFEAGYHAGKVRTPLTENDIQGLFGKKEEDNG